FFLQTTRREPLRPYLLCKVRGIRRAQQALQEATAGGTGCAPNSREEKRARCARAMPAWARGRVGKGEALPVFDLRGGTRGGAGGGGEGGKGEDEGKEGGKDGGKVEEEILRAVCQYVVSPLSPGGEGGGEGGTEEKGGGVQGKAKAGRTSSVFSRRPNSRRPRRIISFKKLASEGKNAAEAMGEEGMEGGGMTEAVFEELMMLLAPAWDPARREGGREGGGGMDVGE
ncbi:hypothetical protein Naga_101623g1, partial [Nannochloropsis gaditana]